MSDLNAVARVWMSAIAALIYVYTVVSRLPKNLPRLIATLPIVHLFFLLPWQISSVPLRGGTAFCLSWMSNIKRLLFCFDSGPLPLHRHSLRRFLAFAALPVDAKQSYPRQVHPHPENDRRPLLSRTLPRFALACALIVPSLKACGSDFAQRHRAVVLPVLYTLVLFCNLEVLLVASAVPARLLLAVELQPQVDQPYRATSLADFWGRRWNHAVPTTLRPAVYCPVRWAWSRLVDSSAARLAAMLTAFPVSGLMHELMLYYLILEPPTWEWAALLVLQGFLASGELWFKSVVGFPDLPRLVSLLLTMAVLYATAAWLFYPPMIRARFDVIFATEFMLNVDLIFALSLITSTSSIGLAGLGRLGHNQAWHPAHLFPRRVRPRFNRHQASAYLV